MSEPWEKDLKNVLEKLMPPKNSPSIKLPVGYYFLVTLLFGGLEPNPLDIRFQEVQGISAEISYEEIKEGGENANLFLHYVPSKTTQPKNLILKRGMVMGSPIGKQIEQAMNELEIIPGSVLVSVLDEESSPHANWLFLEAFPVKWSITDLNAKNSEIIIETIEMKYSHMRTLRR